MPEIKSTRVRSDGHKSAVPKFPAQKKQYRCEREGRETETEREREGEGGRKGARVGQATQPSLISCAEDCRTAVDPVEDTSLSHFWRNKRRYSLRLKTS